MEKILKDTLLDLGCSDKEIKFFIINYTLGPSSITHIAKKARLERSTAYLIAQNLVDKGLLIEDLKHYKKTLTPIEPKTLLRMLSARLRQIGRHEITLQENLPQLQSLHQISSTRPSVRTYDGETGLLSIWQDILSSPQQEVLLWTNQQTESNFFSTKYHNLFIKERLKKNIPLRVLAVNNPKGKLLLLEDITSLRQTKLLPPGITFSAETYIYGNKIAILDYNKDIIGIIISSEQIASSQKSIFEMNWKQLIGNDII